MKLYATNYARINFSKGVGSGFTVFANFQYQDRMPLENTTNYSWNSKSTKPFRPNYPIEISTASFTRHQASMLTIGVTIQPKSRYIEFPDRTINIGSSWPSFNLLYTKGINSLFGSDVDYDKWQLTIRDNLNLKLAGRFNYRIQTGGFLNNRKVEIQDMKHFPGNRLIAAEDYLTTFQLPQYYLYSNAEKYYATVFVEHHFNGLLTNKIPGIKKLNWNLVSGVNVLWLPKTTYAEWHVGFENIFRFFRIDIVTGYTQDKIPRYEYRVGYTLNLGRSDD